MSALLNRAIYFYEMSSEQMSKYSKKEINKDNDLACCIGYVLEQALELALKDLCGALAVEHPETHKLAVILNAIRTGINRTNRLDLIHIVELKTICDDILPDVRFYNNLAYGARYISDLKVDYGKLEKLDEITSKILRIAKEVIKDWKQWI